MDTEGFNLALSERGLDGDRLQLTTGVSWVPDMSVYPFFKKVAVGASVSVAVTLLGGIAFQNVTP